MVEEMHAICFFWGILCNFWRGFTWLEADRLSFCRHKIFKPAHRGVHAFCWTIAVCETANCIPFGSIENSQHSRWSPNSARSGQKLVPQDFQCAFVIIHCYGRNMRLSWEFGCELMCTACGMGMCYCSVLISKEQSDLSLMGETADCQSLQSKVVAHRLLLEKYPSNAQVGRKYSHFRVPALPLHARDTLKLDVRILWETTST